MELRAGCAVYERVRQVGLFRGEPRSLIQPGVPPLGFQDSGAEMEQPQGPPPERADVDEAAAAAQAPNTGAAVHDDGTGGAEGAGGGGDAAAVENADGNPYDEDRPHDDGHAPAAAAVAPSPNVADPGVGQAAAEDPTGGPALQLGGHEAHLQDALQEPPEQRQTLPNVDLGGMGYVQRTSVCRVSHRKPLTPGCAHHRGYQVGPPEPRGGAAAAAAGGALGMDDQGRPLGALGMGGNPPKHPLQPKSAGATADPQCALPSRLRSVAAGSHRRSRIGGLQPAAILSLPRLAAIRKSHPVPPCRFVRM